MNEPLQTFPDRPLTKEEFLQRWCLVRAESMALLKSRVYTADMIREAEGMWDEIQKVKSK